MSKTVHQSPYRQNSSHHSKPFRQLLPKGFILLNERELDGINFVLEEDLCYVHEVFLIHIDVYSVVRKVFILTDVHVLKDIQMVDIVMAQQTILASRPILNQLAQAVALGWVVESNVVDYVSEVQLAYPSSRHQALHLQHVSVGRKMKVACHFVDLEDPFYSTALFGCQCFPDGLKPLLELRCVFFIWSLLNFVVDYPVLFEETSDVDDMHPDDIGEIHGQHVARQVLEFDINVDPGHEKTSSIMPSAASR